MIRRDSVFAAPEPQLIPQADLVAVIDAVLRIVTQAWLRIRRARLLTRTHRQCEVITAGLLYQHMCAMERARQPRRPRLKIKSEAATFSAPDQPTPDGRIDIEIIYSLADDPDLRLECKRISTSAEDDPTAKARYYVNGGVLRFVGNRYGRGHAWGVLIAFVIDGHFRPATELVGRYVAEYGNDPPHLAEAWRPATAFIPRRHIFSTTHIQDGGPRTIRLLHLFLPFPRTVA